jgi:biotin carboxyl carrier protein
MKLTFSDTTLDVSSNGKTLTLTLDDQTLEAEVLHSENGKLDLLIDGRRVTAYVSSDSAKRWVTINGQTIMLTKSTGARQGGHGRQHAAGELTAPMPGQVRAVNINEGDRVTKGQTLLILEAMKMEIRIHALQAGVVKKILVSQGQTVEREQTLIEMGEN